MALRIIKKDGYWECGFIDARIFFPAVAANQSKLQQYVFQDSKRIYVGVY
jgi:hypothetical protein